MALLGSLGKSVAGNIGAQTQGILTTKPTAKFVSGARTIIRVNGQLVGFAFGVSWRIQTIADEIYTIDDALPKELAPNKIMITGNLSSFRVPGMGPTTLNHQATLNIFPVQAYINIEVRDTATDHLLLYVPQAMVTDHIEDIRSESLGTVSLSWKAIGWKDERTPAPIEATKEASIEDKSSIPGVKQSTIDGLLKSIKPPF